MTLDAPNSGAPGDATKRQGSKQLSMEQLDQRRVSSKAIALGAPSSAFVLEVAEIETRLRTHILELFEPLMRRTSVLEARMQEMHTTMLNHTAAIGEVRQQLEAAESFRGQLESFRQQMSEAELARTIHEQRVGDRLSLQEIEIDTLRQSKERQLVKEGNFERALKTMGDMMASTREEMTVLRQQTSERWEQGREKLGKLRDEFETRSLALESASHRLQDSQTKTSTTVSHMQSQLKQVTAHVDGAVKTSEDLARSKASINIVEEQQQEHNEFMRQITASVAALRRQFETCVDDVKAHFQTAADVVGISTAKQMDEMRSQYRDDTKRCHTVLQEIDNFFQEQKGEQLTVKDMVGQVREDFEVSLDDVRRQVEDGLQKEEQARKELVVDVQQMKSRSSDLGAFRQHRNGIGGLGIGAGNGIGTMQQKDVVSLLLEAQLLGATLASQDDQDRRSVALYGYKAGDCKASTSEKLASTLPDIDCGLPHAGGKAHSRLTPRRRAATGGSTPRAATTGAIASDQTPVVTIDKRCLSCSGSTATVLAGFKLACLEYFPSPVQYQKVTYQRTDLIRLQLDLLNQAKEQIKSLE